GAKFPAFSGTEPNGLTRNNKLRVRPELNLRAQSKRVESALVVSPKGLCYEPVNLLTGGLR
ncbi:hypothetical protein C5S36_05345, partial [Candidatus Methanophagaceae archaeon]